MSEFSSFTYDHDGELLSGVYGDGLSTAVHPAANAGPILARFSRNGKLNGVIRAATP